MKYSLSHQLHHSEVLGLGGQMTEMKGICSLVLVFLQVVWILKIPVHNSENIYQKMNQQLCPKTFRSRVANRSYL